MFLFLTERARFYRLNQLALEIDHAVGIVIWFLRRNGANRAGGSLPCHKTKRGRAYTASPSQPSCQLSCQPSFQSSCAAEGLLMIELRRNLGQYRSALDSYRIECIRIQAQGLQDRRRHLGGGRWIGNRPWREAWMSDQ
jgi:hypothetical protein